MRLEGFPRYSENQALASAPSPHATPFHSKQMTCLSSEPLLFFTRGTCRFPQGLASL